jgi:hypothetical protein
MFKAMFKARTEIDKDPAACRRVGKFGIAAKLVSG